MTNFLGPSSGGNNGEVDRNLKIFIKLKKLLDYQKEQLYNYFILTEKEQEALDSRDMDKLNLYLEQESSVIKRLRAWEKVITPLDEMVKSQYDKPQYVNYNISITKTREDIDKLRDKVQGRISMNRLQLEKILEETKIELRHVKKNNSPRGNYQKPAHPTFIDISR